MKKFVYVLLLLMLFLNFVVTAGAYSVEEASFSIVYNDLKIPLNTFSIFVLPREGIEIYIAEEDQNEQYIIELGGKEYQSNDSFKWQAHAKPGHYPVTIRKKNSSGRSSKINLNVFVLHPFSEKKGVYINGFKIGHYPSIPPDKELHYSIPKGFLKIEESLLDLKVTPHFKMEQLLTKQRNQCPQYIVIKEKLLLKMEYLLKEVNNSGYEVDTFGIVSLYRSPYFNKKLGNQTDLSRHLFGDAVDIYIDNDNDNWMDDLNSDGKINKVDANVLFNIAQKFDQQKEYKFLQGGLSSYKGNGVRGPFIHIDTRGFHVNW